MDVFYTVYGTEFRSLSLYAIVSIVAMMTTTEDHELARLRHRRIRKLIEDEKKAAIPTNSSPVHLDDTTFEQFIKEKPIVFVDFWAEWCNPCRRVEPILEELAAHFEGKVWVGKVNVDKHRNLAMKYGASSIPTFWAFINGEPIQRYVGLMPKQSYASIFRELIKAAKKRDQ